MLHADQLYALNVGYMKVLLDDGHVYKSVSQVVRLLPNILTYEAQVSGIQNSDIFVVLAVSAHPFDMHAQVLPFHWSSKLNMVDGAVVVGSAIAVAEKLAPNVKALAVPSSVICIVIMSPATGVPERFVVNDVIAWASPVIVNMSPLSVFIVGVADCVVDTTRFLILGQSIFMV